MFGDLKLKRAKQMCPLEKQIVMYLAGYMDNKPVDTWYHYKGEFKYDGKAYDLECDCRMDNQIFSYKNLLIEHKQEIIYVEDMIEKGFITRD